MPAVPNQNSSPLGQPPQSSASNASGEWQELTKVCDLHMKLIYGSETEIDEHLASVQQQQPSLPFLATRNPVSQTNAYNNVLLFEHQNQSTAVLTAAAAQLAQHGTVNSGAFHSSALLLSYFGGKIPAVTESTFVHLFKQFCKTGDIASKRELISACAQIAGSIQSLPATSAADFAKDIAKAWKSDANYQHVEFLQFLNQFFRSQLFLSASNPLLGKAFWADVDVILKHIIRSFAIHNAADGIGKLTCIILTSHLLRYSSKNAYLANVSFRKRLSRMTTGPSVSDVSMDFPNRQLISCLLPSSSPPTFMFPFTLLASYMFKYRNRTQILAGIVDIFHVMLLDLGAQFVQEHLLVFLRFFTDLATNPKYDIFDNNMQGDWMECSLMRRELISYLIENTIIRTLLSGVSIDLVQNCFSVGMLEPFLKQLTGFSATAVMVAISPHVVNVFTFLFHQLCSVLIETGRIGSLSSNPPNSQSLLDTMLTMANIFTEVDGNISFTTFPVKLATTFAFALKQLIQANPNNSFALKKVIVMQSHNLELFDQHDSTSLVNVEKLVFASIILCTVIASIPFSPIHSCETWTNNLASVAGVYIQNSVKAIDNLNAAGSASLDAESWDLQWKKAAAYGWIGWNVIGALTCLDTGFVKTLLPQWLLLWKTFLVKVNSQSLSPEYIMWTVMTREAALTAMWNMLRNNFELCSADISRRLLGGVLATLSTVFGFSSNAMKTFDLTQKYRPPDLYHYFSSLVKYSALPSSTSAALSSSNSAASQYAVATSFLQEYPACRNVGPAMTSMFLMSIYNRPKLHLQLLQKRAYEILILITSRTNVHPKSYEAQHVVLLRDLMDRICGDYLTAGLTNDLTKIMANYDIQDPMKDFIWDSDETMKLTSLIRGTHCDIKTGAASSSSEYENAPAASRRVSIGSGSLLPTAASSPVVNILKTLEGLGPTDLLDVDRAGHWVSASIENDPCLTWSVLPTTAADRFPFEQLDLHNTNSFEPEPAKLYLPRPVFVSTALADVSINLFGILYLAQNETYQEVLIDQMLKTVKMIQSHLTAVSQTSASADLKERISKRLVAVQINCISALLSALSWNTRMKKMTFVGMGMSGSGSTSPDGLCLHLQGKIVLLLQEFCTLSWSSPHSVVRTLGAELLGRLAKSVLTLPASPQSLHSTGMKYANEIIKLCLDTISTSTRDANLRAGAVISLGTLFQSIGSMSLQVSQIRTLLNIMTALVMDAHVTVHTWTLYSFWLILDACGVDWITSLGGKELSNAVMSICYSVLASDSHRSFLTTSGQETRAALVGVNPAIICPYRSVLRLLQSLLNAFGPELLLPSGQEIAHGTVSLLTTMQNELLEGYRLLQPPLLFSSPAEPPSTPSVFLQLQLKFAPFSFNLKSDENLHSFVPNSIISSIIPYQYILTEHMTCLQALVTFNVMKYLPPKSFLQVQALLSPASSHAVPLSLRRAAARLLWNVNVVHDQMQGIWSKFNVDHLLYILDFAIRNEGVMNGAGRAGTMEDDVFISTGFSFAESLPISSSFLTTQIFDILIKWYQDDVAAGKINKWIARCQRVINRSSIVSRIGEVVDSPAKDPNSADTDDGGESPNAENAADGDDGGDGDAGGNDDAGDAGSDSGDVEPVDSGPADDDLPNADAKFQLSSGPMSSAPVSPVFMSVGKSDGVNFLSDRIKFSIVSSPLASQSLFEVCLRLIVLTISSSYKKRDQKSQLLNWNMKMAKQWQELDKKSTNKEQLATLLEGEEGVDDHYPLVLKLNDMIRLAFSATTDTHRSESIRIVGLSLMECILDSFGPLVDPDFPEYSLLEQYQAQITSGLTLAFTSGQPTAEIGEAICLYPSLQSYACKICANYICSGICPDESALGRVLKVLSAYLEFFNSPAHSSLDTSNADTMIKIAVISAWSHVFVQSEKQQDGGPKYLKKIVAPFIEILIPAVLSSALDFAKLKASFQLVSGFDISIKSSVEDLVNARRPSIDVSNPSRGANAVILFLYARNRLSLINSCIIALEHHTEAAINFVQPSKAREQPKFIHCLLGECVETILDWISLPPSCNIDPKMILASLDGINTFFNPTYHKPKFYVETDAFTELMPILQRATFKECNDLPRNVVVDRVLKILERIVKSFGVSYLLDESDCIFPLNREEATPIPHSDRLFVFVKVLLGLFNDALDEYRKTRASLSQQTITRCLDMLCGLSVLGPNSASKLYIVGFSFDSVFRLFAVPNIDEQLVNRTVQYVGLLFNATIKSISELGTDSPVTACLQDINRACFGRFLQLNSRSMENVLVEKANILLLTMTVTKLSQIANEAASIKDLITFYTNYLKRITELNQQDLKSGWHENFTSATLQSFRALMVNPALDTSLSGSLITAFIASNSDLLQKVTSVSTTNSTVTLVLTEYLQLLSELALTPAHPTLVFVVIPELYRWIGTTQESLAVACLIRIASTQPQQFKAVIDQVEQFKPAMKERLESSVRDYIISQQRKAQQQQQQAQNQQQWSSFGNDDDDFHAPQQQTQQHQPSIQLKMNFGK